MHVSLLGEPDVRSRLLSCSRHDIELADLLPSMPYSGFQAWRDEFSSCAGNMIQPWMKLASSMILLGLDAQRVVLLRMATIAAGGARALGEMNRMMSEKLFAAVRAAGMMTFGQSPQSIVQHYRSEVRANETATISPKTLASIR